jgi:ABC-type multidrug transport system fused ATPase/permease subunit
MYAYYSITGGELYVGDFVIINVYILQIYWPLNFLGSFWSFIRDSMNDVEMVFDLLALDDVIKEVKNPIDANIKRGEIEFKKVSFSYEKKNGNDEDRKMVFKNLSFKVPAGKSVGIVGTTGAGKSTIMRLIYRFYDVDSG